MHSIDRERLPRVVHFKGFADGFSPEKVREFLRLKVGPCEVCWEGTTNSTIAVRFKYREDANHCLKRYHHKSILDSMPLLLTLATDSDIDQTSRLHLDAWRSVSLSRKKKKKGWEDPWDGAKRSSKRARRVTVPSDVDDDDYDDDFGLPPSLELAPTAKKDKEEDPGTRDIDTESGHHDHQVNYSSVERISPTRQTENPDGAVLPWRPDPVKIEPTVEISQFDMLSPAASRPPPPVLPPPLPPLPIYSADAASSAVSVSVCPVSSSSSPYHGSSVQPCSLNPKSLDDTIAFDIAFQTLNDKRGLGEEALWHDCIMLSMSTDLMIRANPDLRNVLTQAMNQTMKSRGEHYVKELLKESEKLISDQLSSKSSRSSWCKNRQH
eukprot:m.10746 g.10746  ORF g.10746 m.10746 type:complete len:380 (+) comp22615_c0_seq1:40-1179(+)